MRYFKDKRTGRVFCIPDNGVPREPKSSVGITEEQYRDEKRKEGESYSIGSTLHRIYASVTHDTFTAFAKRCHEEEIGLDGAFAGLVRLYAEGGMVVKKSKGKKDA